MNDLDSLELTVFNADNINNPGLLKVTINGFNYYYLFRKIKSIGSNYVVWDCELDVYTTFIYALYIKYETTGFKIKTTRSQKLTPGVMNDDPLVKNFNLNGKWWYKGSYKPDGKYKFSFSFTNLNPVVYAIINTNTANNSSLTLIPILSKSNSVSVVKLGTTTTTNLPKRVFVFNYDNGDHKSVNSLARNTNAVCYNATGPGDPGVRSFYAKLAGNPNVTADKNLGFLELTQYGAGGLEGSWISNGSGWGNISYNYAALRQLVQQYSEAGSDIKLGIVNGYSKADYTSVSKWPVPSDGVYGYWYDDNLNGATFDKIRIKYTFDRKYLANVKYAPYVTKIAVESADGQTLAAWNGVHKGNNTQYSDIHQFYSTYDSGASTQDFNTAIMLTLNATTATSTRPETYEVNNSWSNINNLLLNNYSNKVVGLFLGPPVYCFEDNYVFENLADGRKYLTLTLDKDGLPVRNYDFNQYTLVENQSDYTDKFNFLTDSLSDLNHIPWWLEIYMPKMLFNNKFNFAKYLYNQRLTNKTDDDLVNTYDGYFTFNGTTNFIYLNEFDMPKDCIYQLSGALPFYNDTFKQYVQSTTNSVNTGYQIAKQNAALDIVGNIFGAISQAASAAGSAAIGNLPGAIQGAAGYYSSLMNAGAGGLKLVQQKNKIKAHYADKKNVSGASITNSLMIDVLNLREWYQFESNNFIGLIFEPTVDNMQALGELITINGFLTEQDTEFASNFNVDGIYLETAPVLFAEEGLNKLINDQKFKDTIPTPYYQNVVHEFLNRILTIKDN